MAVRADRSFVRGPALVNLVVLLLVSQAIAYIDRVNLSVAAPVLIRQFHYDTAEVGLLFSIFNWVFTVALLGAGPFVDRAGPRTGYLSGVGLWSIGTIACGISAAFAPLAFFRSLVGIGEAPMIPAGQRIIAERVPPESRTQAVGAFFAGNEVGLAVGIPFAAVLLHAFGLPAVFYVTGLLGFAWIAWFLVAYRAIPRDETPSTTSWGDLLRYRTTWGLMIGNAGYL